MTLIEFLEQYRTACISLDRIEEKIEREKAMAERATSVLSLTPHSSPGELVDKREDIWAALADSRVYYATRLMEALDIQRDIEKFLNTLKTPKHQLVLRMKYIDGYTWEQIAEMMGKYPRQIYYIRQAALKEAEKAWRKWKNGNNR